MKSIKESLQEYARGITGGLLFSLPLLYTMEVWWAGFVLQPYQLFIYVATTFLLLMGYNRYAGVHEGATWKEVIIDSFEEIGIGLILSFVVLWQLGRLNLNEMNLDEIMGKIIIETMNVAIGVSVGTAQLGVEVNNNKDDGNNKNSGNKENRKIDLTGQIVLTFCGSILIAGNVAPTEEIPVIAFEITPVRVLIILFSSLLLGAIILFFSSFRGSTRFSNNIIPVIVFETCMTYVIALCSSAFMLWFFGRFDNVNLEPSIYQVIVLGMPAMLGASAGRLLIK